MNRVFLALCLVSGVWLLSYSLAYQSRSPDMADLLGRIGYCGVVFIPITVFHFTVRFLQIYRLKKIVVFNYLVGFIWCFYIWCTSYLVKGVYKYFWGFYPLAGKLHPVFLVFFMVLMTISLVFLAYYLWINKDKLTAIKRMQVKYFFLAGVIYSFASVDFLPNYGIHIYPFGYIPAFIFILLIAYAIIRYRLMDIRLAITKTGIFLFVYTLILGVPFYVGYRTHSWVISTTLAVIFATVGYFVYRFLQRKAEELLLAQQRHYQHLLLQAAKGMVREHNLERLLKLMVYIVKKAVKVRYAAVFVYNKEKGVYELKAQRGEGVRIPYVEFGGDFKIIKYIREKSFPFLYEEMPRQLRRQLGDSIGMEVGLVVPAVIEDRLIGFLVLGDKLDRSAYSQDDINVFKILSNQAALAIENCIFFEEFRKAQERIFEAEKLASIGGMADGVAHQIKNRLNHFFVVGGELKLEVEDFMSKCGEHMKDEKVAKSIGYINELVDSLMANAERTNDVVQGILSYARTSEKDTYFDWFSLREVIELSLELLRVKHHVNEAPVKVELGVDEIYGVKAQIMESIYNLLDNAYEATKEKQEKGGGGYIPQVVIRTSENHEVYRIEVRDNGIGIKDEDKMKIFAPFFSTKSSYKERGDRKGGTSGTGIGMYVVKRLIEENHKGRIWFESEYTKGTTFYIELPKKREK